MYAMRIILCQLQLKIRSNSDFKSQENSYQFQALPNGISCAPKQFTRLMKPVYASLQMLGHTNSGYIDDSLLLAYTYSECEDNVSDTVDIVLYLLKQWPDFDQTGTDTSLEQF